MDEEARRAIEDLLRSLPPLSEEEIRERLEADRYMDWEERWLERQTYIYNSGC